MTSPDNSFAPDWEVGLTIRRQVIGFYLEPLLSELSYQQAAQQGMEIRWPTQRPQKHSAGINLLNAPETRTRSNTLGIVSVENARKSLLTEIPSLSEVLELDTQDIGLQRTGRGPKFVVVKFTPASEKKLHRERQDITKHLDKLRNFRDKYDWLARILDLTVAYLPGNTPESSVNEIKQVARHNKPRTIGFTNAFFIEGSL